MRFNESVFQTIGALTVGKRNLYKVIVKETISYTTYVFGETRNEVEEKVINTDVEMRSNQDFEQSVIEIVKLKPDEMPIGLILNY